MNLLFWRKKKLPLFRVKILLDHKDGDQVTVLLQGTNAMHVAAVANGIRLQYPLGQTKANMAEHQAAADEVWKAMDVVSEKMNAAQKVWNKKYDE